MDEDENVGTDGIRPGFGAIGAHAVRPYLHLFSNQQQQLASQ
jgi:hypothetical protein